MIAEIVTLVSGWEEGPAQAAGDRMADRLAGSGLQVLSRRTLLQEAPVLEQALAESLELFDLVLILDATTEGGERTLRKVLAQISGRGLVLMEDLLEDLRRGYGTAGLPVPGDIETRALLPRHARWIPAAAGERPGLWMEIKGKYVMVLPPGEQEAARVWEGARKFWPRALQEAQGHSRCLTLSFASSSPEKVRSVVEETAPGARLDFRSEGCLCRALLCLEGPDPLRLERDLEAFKVRIADRLQEEFLGEGEETLEGIVGRLLIRQGIRISVAESCTGGWITALLVGVPGISAVLDLGVVTYSNGSKKALLHLSDEVLEAQGAVSRVAARAMAQGVKDLSGTDIGVAVTGIAGPTGGTPEKPVGTVFIGLSTPGGNEVMEYRFEGDRRGIRLQSAQMALDRVRRYLLGL